MSGQDTPEAAPKSYWLAYQPKKLCGLLTPAPCFSFLLPPKLTFLCGQAAENMLTLLAQARGARFPGGGFQTSMETPACKEHP